MGQMLRRLLHLSGEAVSWCVITIFVGEIFLGLGLGLVSIPLVGWCLVQAAAWGVVDLWHRCVGH